MIKFPSTRYEGSNPMDGETQAALLAYRDLVVVGVRSDEPDLTARQQAIMLTIATSPKPETVRGLARQLNIAKPAVTRALDTLQKSNFVVRRKDQDDLRNVLFYVTPTGREYLREFGRTITAYFDVCVSQPVAA